MWQTQYHDGVERALPLLTRMLMLPLPFHAATASGACTLRASSVCLLVSRPREAASASLHVYNQTLPEQQLMRNKPKITQAQHIHSGKRGGSISAQLQNDWEGLRSICHLCDYWRHYAENLLAWWNTCTFDDKREDGQECCT